MPNKLGTIALRIFWEAFALCAGFLVGALPTLLITGGIAWTIVDPGCSCFAQRIVLAKVQLERYQTAIAALTVLMGLISYFFLRRYKFGFKDLIDLGVAAIVFGGAYLLFGAMFHELPSITSTVKVPLDILVPMGLQTGIQTPDQPNPIYPWKASFAFVNNFTFVFAMTAALAMFFGFGDSFRLVPKLLEPRKPEAAPQVEGKVSES